ncbi:hypothetical protein ACP4OV_005960 [Aristida adscensionis]
MPRQPTCCTATNRALVAEMPCLCCLLADRVLLFNVTTDQMFKLPARCSLLVVRASAPTSQRRCRPPSRHGTMTTRQAAPGCSGAAAAHL